jgi:hypothetical protein
MDLRVYYQKIRAIQSKIEERFPIIVSLETGSGGKSGELAEVSKDTAARMIVDGAARLATAEEAKRFVELRAEAKELADRIAAASKVQLAVLSSSELNRLKGLEKEKKG